MTEQQTDQPMTEQQQTEAVCGQLRQQIAQYPILLYMKGNPQQPQCGFSARACGILSAVGKKFAWVDILSEPLVRRHLPSVSEWPTFPQLFVKGELLGGSDIIAEMYESGELAPLLQEAEPG